MPVTPTRACMTRLTSDDAARSKSGPEPIVVPQMQNVLTMKMAHAAPGASNLIAAQPMSGTMSSGFGTWSMREGCFER